MTRILATDESGDLTIPAEFLTGAAPHARYVIEKQGRVIRLEPEIASDKKTRAHQDWRTWLDGLDALTAKLNDASTTNPSAVEILSEMRR